MSRLLPALLALVPAPAVAIGLAPLAREGVTDGPGKAFYLTVSNPYASVENFQVHSVELSAERSADRVLVYPSHMRIAAGSRRKVLVVVRPLLPGERYTFRVCAERAPRPEETINARVCSKLTARRLRPGA